ncbi:uncharacterized protein LOC128952007 [Oppia nitens]|uniref:uncharacterized protein LOC128952007 n=1 Tax=Oppia nitens TaxID=1686743 RepID=UPI0023DCA21B|nr:uncharacterized protein LOC128952007 [Oppia nitens]
MNQLIKLVTTVIIGLLAILTIQGTGGTGGGSGQVWASEPYCPNATLMVKCVTDAEHDWEIDRNRGSDNKSHCCFQRQYYRCQKDLSDQCQGQHDRYVSNLTMFYIKEELDHGDCADWTEDRCMGLAWWAITLIVLGSLLGASIIGCAIYALFCRRRCRNK